MQFNGTAFQLSATDLVGHLGCGRLTELDRSVAAGKLEAPKIWNPVLEVLRARGDAHETAYTERLRAEGRSVTVIEGKGIDAAAIAATKSALESGVDVIAQAALFHDTWTGRADFLIKVDLSSALGGWSYEVVDTKLARQTKGGTILQLCLYSELLGKTQGVVPEFMHVVTPGEDFVKEKYRVDDFAAYFRFVRERLLGAMAVDGTEIYPDPTKHCDVCRWFDSCDALRRRDDHLCFVAGLGDSQLKELRGQDINTLAKLAEEPLPLTWKPNRGAKETFGRLREQARVQLQGRAEGRPIHELLPVEPDRGFCTLPEPSQGDVFFDLEGDQFVGIGGLEYLFGYVTIEPGPIAQVLSPKDALSPSSVKATDRRPFDWADSGEGPEWDAMFQGLLAKQEAKGISPSKSKSPTPENLPQKLAAGVEIYQHDWSFNRSDERAAFEKFIDFVMKRWEQFPDMHVYHFAPYEPSTLKRLMGRYASREDEVDRLLRAGVLVDLFAVTRQALRASVESYSIKRLEAFYGFIRTVDLRDAGTHKAAFERALELNELDAISDDTSEKVRGYNQDDCVSTRYLRDWLEGLRASLIADGEDVPRPEAGSGEPSERISEEIAKTREVVGLLLDGVPDEGRTPAQQARWLMAGLLGWHRREEKVGAWEYFRLAAMEIEELADEQSALANLEFVETVGRTPTGIPIDCYRYPPQELTIRKKDDLKPFGGGKSFGKIEEIFPEDRLIHVRKTKASADLHPLAAFVQDKVPNQKLKEALLDLGRWICANGVDSGAEEYRAARDVLLRKPLAVVGSLKREGENTVETARRLISEVSAGVLPIQGPPGTGKTFTAASMICDLVEAGKKVGVTATGHKVIRNLLDEVLRQAKERNLSLSCGHKTSVTGAEDEQVISFNDNPSAFSAISGGEVDVLGGTAWLWASPEFESGIDVLFADEAAQMSLANLLAASRAASMLVLIGDPQQLEQPQKGTHPDGSGVSVLQHILGDQKVIKPAQGLFLEETWRLHPSICQFTSEAFYEGELTSRDGTSTQCIKNAGGLSGFGLRLLSVEHEGNQSKSIEEAEAIAGLVNRLFGNCPTWIDREGREAELTLKDVLIVAPYNAQVAEIERRLPPEARVGTVDRFQGQQAPIVIYSVTTSNAEDAPHGMEFLYSANRINVATSRAKALCILVANPKIFEPDCRTPKQIRLANAFCRYRELADEIQPNQREIGDRS